MKLQMLLDHPNRFRILQLGTILYTSTGPQENNQHYKLATNPDGSLRLCSTCNEPFLARTGIPSNFCSKECLDEYRYYYSKNVKTKVWVRGINSGLLNKDKPESEYVTRAEFENLQHKLDHHLSFKGM